MRRAIEGSFGFESDFMGLVEMVLAFGLFEFFGEQFRLFVDAVLLVDFLLLF